MIKLEDNIQNIDSFLLTNTQYPNINLEEIINFFNDYFNSYYLKNTINLEKINYFYIKLGIGDWGLGPIPNPQSPIPNLFIFLI